MTNKQVADSILVTDFATLCQTVYGEARGEKTQGRIAVVQVILNRVKKQTYFGKTVGEVCMADQQFSCWNEGDPNRKKMLDLTWKECEDNGIFHDVKLAINWYRSDKDITQGSCHYQADGCHAFWSRGKEPCVKIGNHLFYNNVK